MGVNDVQPFVSSDLDDLVRQRQQVLRLTKQWIGRRLYPMERQPWLVVAEPEGRVAAHEMHAVAA